MNEFRIKKKRGIDILPIIRTLYCFLLTLGALFTICVLTGATLFTYKHVLIFSLCSIPFCILYAFTVEKLGSFLGGMLSGWTSRRVGLRDQLSADLEKARHSKRNGHFEESLQIINSVIDKDKDFPDALYLKAQILWEGFGKSAESKKLLKRTMQLVSNDHHLHRWSLSYYDEIIKKEKARAIDSRSNGNQHH